MCFRAEVFQLRSRDPRGPLKIYIYKKTAKYIFGLSKLCLIVILSTFISFIHKAETIRLMSKE